MEPRRQNVRPTTKSHEKKSLSARTALKTTYPAQAQSDVRTDVSMTVNGSPRTLRVEPRTTLLDALRNELGLTGPKKSCDRGECGACTVHVEGRRILPCMTLAAMHDGHRITTIEGLESDGDLHPLQEMFIEHDGFQCGFCTSGQIMSAAAMIEEAKAGWPSAAAVSRPGGGETMLRCRVMSPPPIAPPRPRRAGS